MSNMSYCRFENTYHDLQDCQDNMDNDELSPTEEEYQNKLIDLCVEIALDHGENIIEDKEVK